MWKILWRSFVCYLLLIAANYLANVVLNWVEFGLFQPSVEMEYSMACQNAVAVINRFVFLLIGIGYARALYVLFRDHKRCTLIMVVNGVIAAAGSLPLALIIMIYAGGVPGVILKASPISATVSGLLTVVAAFVFRRWDEAAVKRAGAVTKTE